MNLLHALFDRVRPPRSLGEAGERAAARYLRQRGYRILERNLHAGKDEADLVTVAPDRETVVIVEVKTRREDAVMPEEQVNHHKMRRLTRLAQRLKQQPAFEARPFRFDVIAVVWPEHGEPTIRHHEAAFNAVE